LLRGNRSSFPKLYLDLQVSLKINDTDLGVAVQCSDPYIRIFPFGVVVATAEEIVDSQCGGCGCVFGACGVCVCVGHKVMMLCGSPELYKGL
jgi:hypothetical protein